MQKTPLSKADKWVKTNIDPFVVIHTCKNESYVLYYDKWVRNKK